MPMYPTEVHRSHLTPLRFLQRSASVSFARNRRSSPVIARLPTRSWRSGSTGSPRPCGGRGWRKAIASPVCCRTCRRCWRRILRSPLVGAILVAVNTRLSPPEIAYILNHSGAKVLIVDTELAGLVAPVRGEVLHLETIVSVDEVDGRGCGCRDRSMGRFLASGSAAAMDWPLADEDETIAIDYTSGTTGPPKGVMYTHRGAYLNALGELIETKMTSDSVYLWTLPMFSLQRLVLPVGGDGDRRHPRLPPQAGAGAGLGADPGDGG